jgi:hypothetical protein
VQLHPTCIAHGIDTKHAGDNCREDDFDHGEILKQQLPHDDVVVADPAFLQQKAESKADEEAVSVLFAGLVCQYCRHDLPPSDTIEQHGDDDAAGKEKDNGKPAADDELRCAADTAFSPSGAEADADAADNGYTDAQ